jgi:spermidine/putrescine transport system substrate-binding protein
MKKILFIALSVATIALGMSSCSTAVSESSKKLQIMILVNFLDKELVKEFEAEYAKESGIKDFKVELIELTGMSGDLTKYPGLDLINTLDYRISMMVQYGIIQPLDRKQMPPLDNFINFTVNNYYDEDNAYSIPYSYGTIGILYNPTLPGVDREDMKSWSALWNPKYKGKIIMMDEILREDYIIGTFHSFRDELKKSSENFSTYLPTYRVALASLLTNITTEQVSKVGNDMTAQLPLLVDGKYLNIMEAETRMIKNDSSCALGLFWSCRSNLAMKMNSKLEYSIPQEGTNLHTLNWVLYKNSANPKAAYAFMRFISRPENAKRNIGTICTPSAVLSVANEYRDMLLNGTNTFFDDKTPEWKQQFVENFIPSDETLKRCCLSNPNPEQVEVINDIMKKVTAPKESQ